MADSEGRIEGGAGNWAFAVILLGAMALILAGLFFYAETPKAPENPSMKFEDIQKSLRVVPDATQVIGVEVGGRAKAYRIQDLLRPDQHVINDKIGEVPVAVTFCDIDRCTRIFTHPKEDGAPKNEKNGKNEKKEELNIRVAGTHRDRHGKLLLALGDKKFWQDTGLELGSEQKKVDLRLIENRETTWGEWKALHPDATIYLPEIIPNSGNPSPAKANR